MRTADIMMKRYAVAALLIPGVIGCSADRSTAAKPTAPSSSGTSQVVTPRDELVATVRGTNGTTTKPFEVRKGWELRYDVANGGLTVDLLDPDGREAAQLISSETPGGGSIYPTETGQYLLRISTTGTYVVRVLNH